MPRSMSAEAKRKVSEARRKHVATHPYQPPEQKRCTKCGVLKPIDEFYKTKRKLESTGELREYPRSQCKKCERQRNDAWKDEKKANGTWSEYLRERTQRVMSDPRRHERKKQIGRESAATKRRRQGARVVGPWKRYREQGKGKKLPIGPFSVWLAQQCVLTDVMTVSRRTGYDEKQIRRWTGQEEKTISVEAADKVFVALDHPHEMAVLYPP